ncbi:hypothetical protein PROFUN_08035 [Planoprotostelium fungivorum]|uniref:U3 small nucleolar RNA-associated protein 15 C-terminal domain-containing protein n=1 Tax=Planoprotostelium fungivorum TaxID=1890364 RepID=A0A2P6NKF5_9EUKA|nr:hypothetical protein PROFUN_08035 [Planoprotostelium fungivorum]
MEVPIEIRPYQRRKKAKFIDTRDIIVEPSEILLHSTGDPIDLRKRPENNSLASITAKLDKNSAVKNETQEALPDIAGDHPPSEDESFGDLPLSFGSSKKDVIPKKKKSAPPKRAPTEREEPVTTKRQVVTEEGLYGRRHFTVVDVPQTQTDIKRYEEQERKNKPSGLFGRSVLGRGVTEEEARRAEENTSKRLSDWNSQFVQKNTENYIEAKRGLQRERRGYRYRDEVMRKGADRYQMTTQQEREKQTPGLDTQRRKLEIKTERHKVKSTSREESFWNNFKFPQVFNHAGPVTALDFSHVPSYDLATTNHSRLTVYKGLTSDEIVHYPRFRINALCPKFRIDGQVLVGASEAENSIKLFATSSKDLIRDMRGHNKTVRSLAWYSLTQITSGSDDTQIKLWDVATGTDVMTFKSHTDYVRGLATNHTKGREGTLICSGSYDHSVKLWDPRAQKEVMSIDHSFPVESIILAPGGHTIISAGGPTVKFWDILMGGKMRGSINEYQKTVTSICLIRGGSRIVSAGLDQMVKVHDTSDYKKIASVAYPSPILCVGVSDDETKLAVGMADGVLSVKTRVNVSKAPGTRTQERRGAIMKARKLQVETATLEKKRAVKLAEYERWLMTFQFRQSLDSVLATGQESLIVSMITELARRGALHKAVGGRDEEGLLPILYFLNRVITKSNFMSEVLDLANMVVDIYGGIVGESQLVDRELRLLKRKAGSAMQMQKDLMKIIGSLDLILSPTRIISGLCNHKSFVSSSPKIHITPRLPSLRREAFIKRTFSTDTKELDINEFHREADATLDALCEKYEGELEELIQGDFDATYSDGIFQLKLGELGCYVLNKQSPNRQIWLSSPIR